MDDQMLIQELRKLYRGLEMSAGLMRDRKRTGGRAGAERTADAFARYAATAQSLHALVSARASLAATIPATGHAATEGEGAPPIDPRGIRCFSCGEWCQTTSAGYCVTCITGHKVPDRNRT